MTMAMGIWWSRKATALFRSSSRWRHSLANSDQDDRADAILENCGGEDDFDRSPSPR